MFLLPYFCCSRVALPLCLAKTSKSFNPSSTIRSKKELCFQCFSVLQMCFSFTFHILTLIPKEEKILILVSLSCNMHFSLREAITFHYIEFKVYASTLYYIYTTLNTSERIVWHLIFLKICILLNWWWAKVLCNQHLIEHKSNSNIYSRLSGLGFPAMQLLNDEVVKWGNVNTVVWHKIKSH